MDKDDKVLKYGDYVAAAHEFAGEKEDDLLTDPAGIARARAVEDQKWAHEYGQRLEAARRHKGLTPQEVADKTGIVPELLVQVEKGESFLPLGQLISLSKALSLRVSEVISKGEQPFTVVRSDERQRFSRFGEAKQNNMGYEYEALALQKKNRKMEPFVITLHPAAADEHSSHDGQEFLYVLEGAIEITVNDEKQILKPGDALYYDSSSLHNVRAHGTEPAKILAVLTD